MDHSIQRKSKGIIPTLNLKFLQITPHEFVSSQEFIRNLGFSEATPEYFEKNQEDFGLYMYSFKLKYTDESLQVQSPLYQKEWFIRKRVQDFQDLEKKLKNDPLYHFRDKDVKQENPEWKPDMVMERLYAYLQKLLQTENIQENPPLALMLFLEISYINYGNQTKFKECFLSKKAGGRYGESKCARCGTLWGKWDNRFFIISSESVMYAKGPDIEHSVIREVLNFDYNFTVKHGLQETGYERQIILKSTSRRLQLIAPNLFVYFDFLARLQDAFNASLYRTLHRFDSFAPERQGFCKWYISGQEYYSDLYNSLLLAKQSVYITDWWLSPQFYLQRPVGQEDTSLRNRDSRLDLVLKNIADRGVQVMIIVWQEPSLLLTNDSNYTKTHLESLSTNIKVYRHPNQKIPILWSHHEKMVVIDQKIGFMGGLDLCFGRMDNKDHYLFDYDYEKSFQSESIEEFWPGIDFSNSRVKDFINVKEHWVCLLDNKRQNSKMPWQDIALQVIGDPVIDIARHFIQYWNFVTLETNFKKRTKNQLLTTPNLDVSLSQSTNQPIEKPVSAFQKLKLRFNFGKTDDPSPYSKLTEKTKSSDSDQLNQLAQKNNQGVGNEFKNGHFNAYVEQLEGEIAQESIKQDISKLKSLIGDGQVNRNNKLNIELGQSVSEEQKQMLNDDLRGQDNQKTNIFSSVFISKERENEQPRRLSESILPQKSVHPKQKVQLNFIKMIKQLQNTTQNEEMYYERHSKITHESLRPPELIKEQSDLEQFHGQLIQQNIQCSDKPSGTAMCQMVRSASQWSIGCKNINREMSIQVAYLQLIAQSQNFIYIENQFFISHSAGKPVENQISNAIITRIKQAAMNQEKFKVIVVLPLLPGFEGEIDDAAATVMKIQLHWEYATICRGGGSILEQLCNDPNILDPSDYIEFYSLRQHAKSPLNNQPRTEIIYVHSKLMIVDDEVALIGSANINDRSLMGSRDSEIAMVIHDQNKVESKMAGQVVQRGKFAQTLRTSLYCSHFGLQYDEVVDPLSLDLRTEIRQRTKTNTLVYRKIFACYPDDTVLDLADFENFKKKKNLEIYDELASQIKGQAVEFPLKFLEKENLRIKISQKEYLCPDINFT